MPRITHETITIDPNEIQAEWRRKAPEPFDIQVTTIHDEAESNERSHTLLQMGMGNEGLRVRTVAAARLGELGVQGVTIIDALPFWKLAPSQENLMAGSAQMVGRVAEHIKAQHEFETLHAIGESQGSVAILENMRAADSPLNGRLGLVHPLGLTPDILTVPRFFTRMAQTAAQNDPELVATVVGAHASQRAMGDLLRTGGQQIKAAVGYDGTPAVSEIIDAGQSVAVFTGADDKLFPPQEVEQHLEKSGIQGYVLEIGEGPHASIATRVGAQLAARACYWTQTGLLLPEHAFAEGASVQLSEATV